MQIIPLMRKACHGALLTAGVRLMEPVLLYEFICLGDNFEILNKVLKKRRGHLTETTPSPGTPITLIQAYVPAIESIGLETDIRLLSRGQIFCSSFYSHYQIVEGDPLDSSIELPPLTKVQKSHLARDLMVKTRRRKGMSDDVVITSYFDLEELDIE
ncbi:hypothetical protein GEMRC1_008778 [Eukaryota sp. GEM-RC1]